MGFPVTDNHDLITYFKKLFGLPNRILNLEIAMGLNVVTTVTVTYIPDVSSNETCRTRYRLVELDDEPDGDS